MTTIREVADRAGVSISTVSHVINDTRYVSQDLRERVQAAMRELSYRPNGLARSLRSGKSLTIGLMLPDSSNPYFTEIARGIQDAAMEEGYAVLVGNTDGDLEKEALYGEILLEKQVDGVILIAAGHSGPHIEVLRLRGIPIGVVDRDSPESNVDSVQIDNFDGGKIATRHLIELGHVRIACIAGPLDVYPSYDRVYGYLAALRDAGIDVDPALTVNGNFHADSGFEAVSHLFRLDSPPTAIFACNDMMAIGALGALSQHNLHCPEDVSLVGFDDIQLSRFTNPPLTTISQPKQEMGKQATFLLLTRMAEPNLPARTIKLDASLVHRMTTAKRNTSPPGLA